MSLIPQAAWGQMMPASQAALSKGARRSGGTRRKSRRGAKKSSGKRTRAKKRGRTRTVNGRKLTAKQIAAGFGGKKGRRKR